MKFEVGDEVKITKDCSGCKTGKTYTLHNGFSYDNDCGLSLVAWDEKMKGNRSVSGCCCSENWELVEKPQIRTHVIVHIPTLKEYKRVMKKLNADRDDWNVNGIDTCVYVKNGKRNGFSCLKSAKAREWVGLNEIYNDAPIITAQEFLGEESLHTYIDRQVLESRVEYKVTPAPEINKGTGKIMLVIKNIFRSKDQRALSHFNITNGDGGLTELGREEFIDYLWEINEGDRKTFTEKIVEAYKEEKETK